MSDATYEVVSSTPPDEWFETMRAIVRLADAGRLRPCDIELYRRQTEWMRDE